MFLPNSPLRLLFSSRHWTWKTSVDTPLQKGSEELGGPAGKVERYCSEEQQNKPHIAQKLEAFFVNGHTGTVRRIVLRRPLPKSTFARLKASLQLETGNLKLETA